MWIQKLNGRSEIEHWLKGALRKIHFTEMDQFSTNLVEINLFIKIDLKIPYSDTFIEYFGKNFLEHFKSFKSLIMRIKNFISIY